VLEGKEAGVASSQIETANRRGVFPVFQRECGDKLRERTKEERKKRVEVIHRRYRDPSSKLVLSHLNVVSAEPLDVKTKALVDDAVQRTVVLTTEASLKTAKVCNIKK
jgi:hypothetical protein